MEQREFGNLGEVSSLTLVGGGTGQVWGWTSQQEAVATVIHAVFNRSWYEITKVA